MEHAGMQEVVEVGGLRLLGEVIKVKNGEATIQVYENTSGLKPGEPVYCTGRPLSVLLGPGLLGTIYDGIQRPLERIAQISGSMLKRGEKTDALNLSRKWDFTPVLKAGDDISGGIPFGEVQETESVLHRVMCPPDVEGRIEEIVPAGRYDGKTTLCKVKQADGILRELTMYHYWPVRRGRPTAARLPLDEPLLCGLRVVDAFFPIAKGGAAAIPGGFGTGKTMTQQAVA